jgi:hypothetical protein
MAFAVRHLSVLAYANGFTLWHCKAPKDSMETIMGDNYFREAVDMVTAGDLMMVTAANGARIVSVTTADIATVMVAPLA